MNKDGRIGELRSCYFRYIYTHLFTHGLSAGIKDELRRELSQDDLEWLLVFIDRKTRSHDRQMNRLKNEVQTVLDEMTERGEA